MINLTNSFTRNVIFCLYLFGKALITCTDSEAHNNVYNAEHDQFSDAYNNVHNNVLNILKIDRNSDAYNSENNNLLKSLKNNGNSEAYEIDHDNVHKIFNYNRNSNAINNGRNISSEHRSSLAKNLTQAPYKPPWIKKRTKRASDISQSEMVAKLLDGYIITDLPSLNSTTVVKLGIYVISFYSINEQTMDYSVSMYLRQAWSDPRLNFERHKTKYDYIIMSDGGWNKIWIPDTFLRNEKKASFHGVTVENRMLKIRKNGDLWYVTKISATLSCPMKLYNFPMDTQNCYMMFESFGYTAEEMSLVTLDDPIQIASDLQLPQFALENRSYKDCTDTYTTGTYTCLEITFELARDLGYFLIQVYIPSVLIVILSWVSFWINVDASPARVSIGLLTVLTTTTMSSGARSTLPRVSYIKAIDYWMIVCLFIVFASLIEYAVVNVLSRKVQKPQKQKKTPPPIPARPGELAPPPQPIKIKKKRELSCFKKNFITAGPPEPDGKRRARAVDKFSRKFFPFSFLLFNIIYWVVYFDHKRFWKNIGAT